MIAGTGSSCGKTTIMCGLLKALLKKGENPAAFKCGPDYIDPMFHRQVLEVPSSNLDAFLCGDDGVKYILGEKGKGRISIIEGVMGFYDGLGGISAEYSAHYLSRLTGTPVLLAVNCGGKSLSAAAETAGFLNFLPNNIKGVILNNVSPSLEKTYRDMIREETGAEVYGVMPKIKEAAFESRHLGLVTADETEDISDKMELLGEAAEKYMDMDKIISLAASAPDLVYENFAAERLGDFRLGIAKDAAFCFYYAENLELLESLGAEIVYFSPLKDKSLPAGLHGLIFGGGYPELHLRQLSSNGSFIDSVKNAVMRGIPVWAECGGFVYLKEKCVYGGEVFSLCNILKGGCFMTDKAVRFGYSRLSARRSSFMFKKGDKINAHEFHYSDCYVPGDFFYAEKPLSGRGWECVEASDNIFAGYPHIHFYGNIKAAENFAAACLKYKDNRFCGE